MEHKVIHVACGRKHTLGKAALETLDFLTWGNSKVLERFPFRKFLWFEILAIFHVKCNSLFHSSFFYSWKLIELETSSMAGKSLQIKEVIELVVCCDTNN